MNKDLLNKIEIFLIGGNSTIGNAILDGVLEKHKNKDIEIISFIRTEHNVDVRGREIKVNDYSETIDYININYSKSDSYKIFIISFGVLTEEKKSNNFSENLRHHLDINTFKAFKIFKLLVESKKLLEIHIVSSILGDFIRPSLYSYSLSKNMLEVLIDNMSITKNVIKKVFIWKPAFVESKLNEGRKSTFLKTNTTKIKNTVSKKIIGDKYYIPRYSVFFTFIAKFASPIVNWIDKKV